MTTLDYVWVGLVVGPVAGGLAWLAWELWLDWRQTTILHRAMEHRRRHDALLRRLREDDRG